MTKNSKCPSMLNYRLDLPNHGNQSDFIGSLKLKGGMPDSRMFDKFFVLQVHARWLMVNSLPFDECCLPADMIRVESDRILTKVGISTGSVHIADMWLPACAILKQRDHMMLIGDVTYDVNRMVRKFRKFQHKYERQKINEGFELFLNAKQPVSHYEKINGCQANLDKDGNLSLLSKPEWISFDDIRNFQ